MRLFRHGDALAIVLPASVVSSSGLKEGEELEFIETGKGVFVLLTKEMLSELARPKVGEAFSRNFEKPFPTQSAGAGQPARFPPVPAASGPAAAASGALTPFFRRELESKGFVVVFEEKGAQDFSRDFERDIKAGAVVGTRGFDKKFYVATRVFLENQGPKVLQCLKDGPLSLQQLAEKSKLPEDGIKAIVCILMDEGEVIEKKKGFFAAA